MANLSRAKVMKKLVIEKDYEINHLQEEEELVDPGPSPSFTFFPRKAQLMKMILKAAYIDSRPIIFPKCIE